MSFNHPDDVSLTKENFILIDTNISGIFYEPNVSIRWSYSHIIIDIVRTAFIYLSHFPFFRFCLDNPNGKKLKMPFTKSFSLACFVYVFGIKWIPNTRYPTRIKANNNNSICIVLGRNDCDSSCGAKKLFSISISFCCLRYQ